ncbi:Trp family transcriptional regulator [Streptomyces sp. A144]|uniref:Trp family transcriptional regulator n=1 Tax=Streptomyces sp. A144 TaxID=2871487 RepID=UPI001CBE7D38|nr:Trp family transcriptional regulator [Streptomyces sp. A144]UAX56787.1 hypothetical protein K5X85_29100 [Streptomyces sp. A144]
MTGARPRADVAELLRAGGTYRSISAELGVSHAVISVTRIAYRIPTPRRRGLQGDELKAQTEQRYPQVAAMLRAGATQRQITAATGVTHPTIVRVRRILEIPLPDRSKGRSRTIAEALALYVAPYGDGHARWTGPRAGNQAQLWANGRVYNARHEAFRAHHGRAPVGLVLVGGAGCEEPRCMAGAHLTDQTIRAAHARADEAFDAIFGPAH